MLVSAIEPVISESVTIGAAFDITRLPGRPGAQYHTTTGAARDHAATRATRRSIHTTTGAVRDHTTTGAAGQCRTGSISCVRFNQC